MKKITILSLCLLTLGSAAAQKPLVKEVEREMKGNAASYPESVKNSLQLLQTRSRLLMHTHISLPAKELSTTTTSRVCSPRWVKKSKKT